MKSRSALGVLVLLALGTIAWLATRGSDSTRAVEAPQERAGAASERLPAELERAKEDSIAEDSAEAEQATGPAALAAREEHRAAVGSASLVVRVRESHSLAPLAGALVRIARLVEDGVAFDSEESDLLIVRAAPGATSDDQGECTIEVPAGTRLLVTLEEPGGQRYREMRAIEPLAAGELRIVDFAFALAMRWCGRVIDAETGEALPGSELAFVPRESALTLGFFVAPIDPLVADGAGRLALFIDPEQPWRASIGLAGYGAREVLPLAGHEDPEHEQVIRLARAAALEVVVIGADALGASGIGVSLSASFEQLLSRDGGTLLQHGRRGVVMVGGPARSFDATTDGAGRARIEGLPAEVSFELVLRRGSEELVHEHEPIVLQPGETRDLVYDLSLWRDLAGRVIDTSGAAVAGLDLWLVPAQEGETARVFASHVPQKAARLVKSDEHGRFTFERVDPGTWLLGPACHANPVLEDTSLVKAVPLAILLRVPSQEADGEIVLRVQQDLFIRGSVVDADGVPVRRAHVVGRARGSDHRVYDFSGADGSFELGPLLPGAYELYAGKDSFRMAEPASTLLVEAGSADVAVTIEPSGQINGKVVDAQGRPLVAEVRLLSDPDARGLFGMTLVSSRADGRFAFGSLGRGRYHLIAVCADGRIAVRGAFDFDPGEPTDSLTLQVAPGAKLRVRIAAELGPAQNVLVTAADAPVATSYQSELASIVFTVPPGELEAIALLVDGSRVRASVVLAPGEEREILLR